MKLSVKLVLTMGALTLIIILSNLFSTFQLKRVNVISGTLTEEWLPAIVAIKEVNMLFSDFRLAEVRHVISPTDREKSEYEQSLRKIDVNFTKQLKEYENSPREADEQALYAEFARVNADYDRLHNTILKLSRENKTTEVMQMLNGPSKELYDRANAILAQIVAINVAGGAQASAEGNRIFEESSFMLMTILVVSLLIAGGLSWLLVSQTVTILGKDPNELEEIALRVTRGEYNIDDGSRKIGVYANIVNMVESLKENIARSLQASEQAKTESAKALEAMQNAEAAKTEALGKTTAMLSAADQLEAVVNVVSSASAQLAAQIEQSERGASEQAFRITETATAMEEMNSTVLEVAKSAGQAAEVSISTKARAEAGAAVVLQSVDRIRKVQVQSETIKTDMVKLNDQAQAISQIMGVISDIADQTNLLALNAAIEAARAGEAGRGFAVVADEVRKLAEKTMQSTTDVGNAIRSIQQSVAQSMTQVDSAADLIEEATSLANQSGVALNEIVTMVDRTADQVRAIATAAEEQSASSEEINQSIGHVSNIAGETARAMTEAARAVSELTNQSQVLGRLIENMKAA